MPKRRDIKDEKTGSEIGELECQTNAIRVQINKMVVTGLKISPGVFTLIYELKL